MATNPMMQSPMGQEQEGPAEEAMPGEEAEGGTELCIKIGADGQISVYKESGGDDEGAEQAAQQVSDIGQALAWCLKEFRALDQGGDAQSQFQAGFGDQPKPQRMVG